MNFLGKLFLVNGRHVLETFNSDESLFHQKILRIINIRRNFAQNLDHDFQSRTFHTHTHIHTRTDRRYLQVLQIFAEPRERRAENFEGSATFAQMILSGMDFKGIASGATRRRWMVSATYGKVHTKLRRES